jgi:hypothetical protein
LLCHQHSHTRGCPGASRDTHTALRLNSRNTCKQCSYCAKGLNARVARTHGTQLNLCGTAAYPHRALAGIYAHPTTAGSASYDLSRVIPASYRRAGPGSLCPASLPPPWPPLAIGRDGHWLHQRPRAFLVCQAPVPGTRRLSALPRTTQKKGDSSPMTHAHVTPMIRVPSVAHLYHLWVTVCSQCTYVT